MVGASLFTFNHSTIHIYVLIYVDDILVTSTHTSHMLHLIKHLQSNFPLKDLGELSYFLSAHVVQDFHGVHLLQSKYKSELLHRACMVGAKPSSTLIAFGSKLSRFDCVPLPNGTEYRQIFGALQYCTFTRPDIAFSLN